MRFQPLLTSCFALTTGVWLVATTAPTHAVAPRAEVLTHVNECWSSDNGPVVLDSADFSPGTVDVTAAPATVQVTVAAHDTGGPGAATGIATMRLVTELEPVRLHRSAGLWQGTLTIPRGWAYSGTVGDLHASILATDRGGKVTSLSANGSNGYAVAVTDATPDHAAPVLRDLRVSTHRVDTTRRVREVTVVATVTDPGAGVAAVDAALGGSLGRAPLRHVSGSQHYRGTLVVPRWLGHRRTYVVTSTVTDALGNTAHWSPRKVREQGWDASVRITSGVRDHRRPRLVEVLKVTRHVDLRRHGATATVKVLLADNRGVRSAGVSAGRYAGASLHRVSGTTRHGVWKASLRIPRCGNRAGGAALELALIDQSNNYTSTPLGRLHMRAHDRQKFDVRWVSVSGAFTFAFSAAVHGISTSHVQVVDAHHQPMAGTWACQDHGRAPVPCLTGAVRRARFTPSSIPELGLDGVYWEPDHVLGVLDAAGNPAYLLFTSAPE